MAYAQFEGTYVAPYVAPAGPGGVAHTVYDMGSSQPPSTGSMSQHPGVTYMGGARPSGSGLSSDEVRTVFITGFPTDVRERELHNLVRFLPGFEASQMAVKAGQAPHGFVLFASSAHAHQALEAIAGVPFSIAVAAGPIGSSSQHQVELSGNRSAAPPRTTVVDEEYVNLKSHLPQPIPGTVNTLSGGGNSGTQSTTSNLGTFAGHSNNSSNLSKLPSSTMEGKALSIVDSPHLAANGRPSQSANNSAAQYVSLGGSAENSNSQHMLSASQQILLEMSERVSTAPPVLVVTKLRAEMAHKNLYVKDTDISICRPHRPMTLLPQPGFANVTMIGQPPNAVTYGVGNMGSGDLSNYPSNRQGGVMYSTGVPGAGGLHHLAAAAAGLPAAQHTQVIGTGMSNATGLPMPAPLGFLPVTNRGDNAPCNTLFIGNLSDQVSEMELLQLFSTQPGYRQLKLVRGPRQVSCFVEYEDLDTASAVHGGLQGAVLVSSDRGGIRIQFSKNPFGRRPLDGPTSVSLYRASNPESGSFTMAGSNMANMLQGGGGSFVQQGGQRGMQLSGPLSNGATSIGYTLEGHGHGHGHGQSQMLQFPQIVYSSQGGALVPQGGQLMQGGGQLVQQVPGGHVLGQQVNVQNSHMQQVQHQGMQGHFANSSVGYANY